MTSKAYAASVGACIHRPEANSVSWCGRAASPVRHRGHRLFARFCSWIAARLAARQPSTRRPNGFPGALAVPLDLSTLVLFVLALASTRRPRWASLGRRIVWLGCVRHRLDHRLVRCSVQTTPAPAHPGDLRRWSRRLVSTSHIAQVGLAEIRSSPTYSGSLHASPPSSAPGARVVDAAHTSGRVTRRR